jgi:uncharacterized protein (DUF4415 family)/uncharacterized DUF497 family protein
MFEWDEAKRLKTLRERNLDFRDTDQVFDGRPVLHVRAWRNGEERFVSTARINGKLYTAVWTWRGSGGHEMARKERIERHTANDLAAKRGESRTDWAKAAAMTDKQLEASIAADPDEAGMAMDWDSATVELPQPKADLHMRVDQDVLDFFRKTGKGYQTRINAVLRSYVTRMRHG